MKAVLDVELQKRRHLAPADGVAPERLSTLCRRCETVFAKAHQRASVPLQEVELDSCHVVGRVSPSVDESLGWNRLDHDADPIVVVIPLSSPFAPPERELAAGSSDAAG